AKPRLCPVCRKPTADRFRPFCSGRCADLDLGRWLNESYAIPAVEPPDDWDEEAE
ncbi:MAG: DNA gyrase inhibitor YacG, partial [Alphaproteobacteria bacterium]|nr:DNA gyrase inhibitor YacG [Alphaproteobacteria bacterium]